MKRGWLALVLAAIVMLTGCAEYFCLTADTRAYLDLLNEADAHMEKNEVYEAREAAERLDNRFSSQARIYELFMFHGEVLELSATIAAMRRYAQTGDTSEFLAASARAKRLIMSMQNTRIPRVENIL